MIMIFLTAGVTDMEQGVWIAAFIAGCLLFLCGFLFFFSRSGRSEKRFAGAAFFEFLATWVMYIPEELFASPGAGNAVLQVTEAISTALLKSLNIYGSCSSADFSWNFPWDP